MLGASSQRLRVCKEVTTVKIIQVDGKTEKQFVKTLKQRAQEADRDIVTKVSKILKDVQEIGDKAVDQYSLQFDGVLPQTREVPGYMLQEALDHIDATLLEALQNAKANIWDFHMKQKQHSFIDAIPEGIILGQRVRGLDKVGIYVPGGRAAYPSTVLMNAIPAKIAGVNEIIMVTPPQKDGTANQVVLAAAALAGIDRVFLTGGSQGVAALAYGTETIPAVDKIVGPGNIFVATAKKLLYGQVDIDMIAGPSEILIIADETAVPAYIAADLMSQAEHDPMASAMLVTDSPKLADQVQNEIERQVVNLERQEIIKMALRDYGAIFLTRSLDESINLANELAPEHLEVMVAEPFESLGRIQNAGSVFLGSFAPEPLGDYFAGPNHVLPTNFTAKFFSPLSVDSFIKRSSFIYYPEAALKAAANQIITIAKHEGLTAHAHAISIRQQGYNDKKEAELS